MRLPLILAACLAAGPALAADPLADRIGEAVDIPVEEWMAMALGRTLTYRIDGVFWALERYYPGTNRVILQTADGECLQGIWDYRPPHYCFYWEGLDPACFRHARAGGRILIVETEDGHDTDRVQEMTGVSDVAFTCGPPVIG